MDVSFTVFTDDSDEDYGYMEATTILARNPQDAVQKVHKQLRRSVTQIYYVCKTVDLLKITAEKTSEFVFKAEKLPPAKPKASRKKK